jgi:hypothetical protein
MPRSWIGIRVSAVLTILGSAMTLLLAGLMLLAGFFAQPPQDAPPSPMPLKPVMAVMAAFLVALTAWGISTAIAIFLRRRWARISILVFAVLLTFISAGGMLAILFVQLPATPNNDAARFMPVVRLVIAAFYGALTAIGVWWLVLFNRSRTKEYFAGQGPVIESARPLSISLIAWYMLAGGVFMVLTAVLRLPAMLFGVVFTGWLALAVYAVWAAAQIYLGTGLLSLQHRARIGSIALFCFGAANGVISFVGPSYAEMMRQMQIAMPRLFLAGAQTAVPGPRWVFALLTMAGCAVPTFFLVRRRPAFH